MIRVCRDVIRADARYQPLRLAMTAIAAQVFFTALETGYDRSIVVLVVERFTGTSKSTSREFAIHVVLMVVTWEVGTAADVLAAWLDCASCGVSAITRQIVQAVRRLRAATAKVASQRA